MIPVTELWLSISIFQWINFGWHEVRIVVVLLHFFEIVGERLGIEIGKT